MATDRVVKVSLIASVNDYLAGMERARAATDKTSTAAEKQEKQLGAQRQMFTLLGKSALAASGLIAVGVGVAVAKYAEFDQAMSGVAATGEDARKNINKLTDAAIDAGARTVFSAKESANAIEELAKAGLSAGDILNGGLNGALDLAAAGEMGVADAAGVAATTLGQFQLKGNQASHVADLLAAGAGKAMGDVSDLSQALAQSGTVANQFGISVDDTVGTLAAFANAGMLGSDAGTSFRTMLLRLANPTGEAADQMKALGIQAYDAQGQFVGMQNLAGQLQKGLGKLTQEQRNAALAVIFGQDAIRGANVLYTEGAKGIADWNDKVNDSGYAAETAATRLDNLKGDIEQLGGAIDSAFIGMGKAADGPLRAVTQSLTGMVDGFNQLPEPGKQAVFWVGALGAAALAAGGSALLAVPKIAAYRAAVDSLGVAGQRTTRILSAIGKGAAIGAALTVGIPLLMQLDRAIEGTDRKAQSAIASQKGLSAAIAQLNDGFKGFDSGATMAQAMASLTTLNSNGWSRLSGIWDKSMQAAIDLQSELGDLDTQLGDLASSNLPAARAQFQKYAEATDGSKAQLTALLDSMPKFKQALQDAAKQSGGFKTEQQLLADAMDVTTTATDDSASSSSAAADAYLKAQDAANQLHSSMTDLIDEVMKANGVGQDAVSQNLAYKDALAQVEEKVKTGKKAWGDNTQAGRDNQNMLIDLAKKSQDAATAQLSADQNTDKFRQTLIKGRDALIQNAIKLGASKEAAKAFADSVYKIPTVHETKVIAQTAAAEAALAAIKRRYDNATIRIHVRTDGISMLQSSVGRMVAISKAGGGYIPGVPSTRDNTLAHVASGEFVTRTAQAQKPGNRRVLEWMNAGGDFGGGYANGGFVQPRYASNTTAPVVNVAAPSLEGAVITGRMRLDPDGFVTLIDGRISAAMPSAVSVTSQFGSH